MGVEVQRNTDGDTPSTIIPFLTLNYHGFDPRCCMCNTEKHNCHDNDRMQVQATW